MHQLRDFSKLAESQSAMCTDYIKLLYYDLPQHFSDQYKSYEVPRLCTILEGRKVVKINQGDVFQYEKDGFILLPPHSNVEIFMPEHTKALVYEFDEKLIELVSGRVEEQLNISVDHSLKYKNMSYYNQTNRIKILTNRIQEIFVENDKNMGFLVDLACQELVYELLKIDGCYDIIHSNKNHPIHQAIKLMNEHPESIHSLQSIAHAVNMSASNFSLQFKTITNLTPSEYLTEVKLKKAKSLLHHLPVTETAFELGYQNISHFIKLFKAQNGITPKQYQKLNFIKL